MPQKKKLMELRNKTLSFKIGLALSVIHVCFVGLILLALPSSGQSGIGLIGVLLALDWFVAPVAIPLLIITQNNHAVYMSVQIIVHGILGTIGWFYTPILIAKIYNDGFKPESVQVDKIIKKKILTVVIISFSALTIIPLTWIIGNFHGLHSLDAASYFDNDNKIVFEAMQYFGSQIYVLEINSSKVMKLTSKGQNYMPAVPPDGNKIVFVSNRDGNDEIYIMDSNGINQKRLTNNNIRDYYPNFSPDGKNIVFVRIAKNFESVHLLTINIENLKEREIATVKHSKYIGEQIQKPFFIDNLTVIYRDPYYVYSVNIDDVESLVYWHNSGDSSRPQHILMAYDKKTAFFSKNNYIEKNKKGKLIAEIYIGNINGKTIKDIFVNDSFGPSTQITHNEMNNTPMAIYSDGRKVLFLSGDANKPWKDKLCQVNIDGTGLRQIEIKP